LDLAGGTGVLLASVARMQPRLTMNARLGCTLLRVAAIIFHLSRGEAIAVPLNIVLLALSVFVLWVAARKPRLDLADKDAGATANASSNALLAPEALCC
jgi:hypothetical protein